MKKTVHVCPKGDSIEISKIASRDSIVYKRDCPKCSTPMQFIRKNKRYWKNELKRRNVG